ncbi:hypothetical protein F511_32369 [Dorcoceras hygrometricum]|uniref:Uncharacterized protein n=1 Tax=Dorcoceras hygrometricum TaxID=472368 RepID=A0A2Z7AP51_9LAMI|nr:hypothetical protein F511_32369 [Dorcoceras hygrometricum]
MKIEFCLLGDILAKTIFVKAGSFDAVTHERLLLMTSIISGVNINWSRLLFDILKDMATPGSRQAKGFAIQICVLLKNVPGLELGDSKAFPSPIILTEKTVHRYVVINENVSGEEVANEPRVKKTPIKKAASKKRPAVVAAEPVMKNKRTKNGKSVSSKENLEILPVAQEEVPLQIIEPTSAAKFEQPSVPKRNSKKRRLRLPKDSDDENVENVETPVTVEVTGETVVEQESAVENVIESVDVQRAETAVDISEEETISVFEKSVPTVANVPLAESATEEMGADEEDIDIGGATVSGSAVGSQTVEKADEFELWLNLSYEEFHARQAEQPVVTSSDTDEDIETIDLGAVFARFCLFGGLNVVDIRNFVSSIAEDRTTLRDEQSVNRSIFVSQPIQFIASSEVQHVQRLLDQRPFSSSSSDDSSMHFVEDDIQLGDDAASTQFSLPTVATGVPDAFAQLRASIDQLHFEQIRCKDDVDKLRDTLLMQIHDIEKKFTERFDAHDRTYRVLLNNIRHDARDHKNLLSLDLKSSQQKLSTQVAAAAFDTVDIRKEVKELNAKVTFLDEQSTRSVLGKWVYLVTLAMSLFDLQDVCIAIGSIATLYLPMFVDLIGIYGLKGPYCTLTTTNWFLQALSVIPRGSWGDVARRSYHDPMGKSEIVIPEPQWLWAHG